MLVLNILNFRLDVESKIPDTLGLGFLNVRPEERDGALLCLLKYVVKPDSMTIIFAPTKHHVDFIHLVSFPEKYFQYTFCIHYH